VNISLVIGEFREDGLGRLFRPSVSCNSRPASASTIISGRYKISGLGTLLTGINFVTDDSENAATRYGLHAHAGLLLDGARNELAHCRGFSILTATFAMLLLDRYPRLSLLHGRWPGQTR